MAGTIKKIVAERGFGFIASDDGQEYFFHRSAVEGGIDFDRLAPGTRVEFTIQQSDKGPRAGNVRTA